MDPTLFGLHPSVKSKKAYAPTPCRPPHQCRQFDALERFLVRDCWPLRKVYVDFPAMSHCRKFVRTLYAFGAQPIKRGMKFLGRFPLGPSPFHLEASASFVREGGLAGKVERTSRAYVADLNLHRAAMVTERLQLRFACKGNDSHEQTVPLWLCGMHCRRELHCPGSCACLNC